ncbi:MAG: succinate dehydrogenase, cytochrome b556 subunit [Alphaproteobacteria bacterium]|nr:succinate dehydrogenase, cytochrome b556 subunit [Alphaproteobacteria bacterium]MCB9974341.1 succinate dehydrogenase, cytochrome b556 subunit [Rhodospirillales bacterium]
MSETIKKVQRPLSPHLQVYKLPLTARLSISHRAAGVALSAGTVLVAAFLIAAAAGEESYNFVMGIASSVPGQIILFLWSAALYYHMCNGIRHMFWDTGKFLEKDVAMRTNYIVIMFAFILTAATWACAYLTS